MSTDYFPPIQRAVQGLSPNTQDRRNALYDKARAALLRQLDAADPALTQGQISRERNLLEEAIRRLEHYYDEAELTPEPLVSERPAAPRAAVAESAWPETEDPDAIDEDTAFEEAEAPAEATPKARGDGLPSFVPSKSERRRPQAPRRGATESYLKRYGLVGAVAVVLIGGGIATTLYLRGGSDDKGVIVPPLVAANPAAPAAPAPADPAKLNDRVGGAPTPLPVQQQATINPAPANPAPAPETRSIDPAPATPQQEASAQPQAPAPAPTAPATPAPLLPTGQSEAPEAQRARMLEEDPSAPMKGRVFDGTVTWRTESQATGTNTPLDTVVIGELNFPDRKMKALLTLRRNSDPAFPAAFLLQIQMTVPADYPNGNVGALKGITVKPAPQQAGIPLDGVLMKVTTGVFLMGIADPFNEKGRNAKMLQNNEWFDLMFTFDNGRNAMFTFEKGKTGDKVFNDAMNAWNNGTAAAQ